MVADRTAPPSAAQQRLLFLNLLEPESPAYTVTIAIEVRGAVRTAALTDALIATSRRHEAMRAVLRRTSGTVRQHCRDDPPPVQVVDMSVGPVGPQILDRVLGRLAGRKVDLLADPPARWSVLRLAADRHVVVLVTHHAFFDGGSLPVVSRDIELAFASAVRGVPSVAEPVAASPFDLVGHELIAADDAGLRYWRRRLDDLPSAPSVFARRPIRPASRPHMLRTTPAPGLTAAVRALARRLRCTPNVVLVAALACLIGRLGDRDDVVVLTPVSTRDAPGRDDVVGLFVNLLPLRIDLSGRPHFEDLVLRVRDAVLDGIEHRHVPFERMVATLPAHRRAGTEPVFGVQFVYQSRPVPPSLPGLNVRVLDLGSPAAKFDLSVTVTESDGLQIDLEASPRAGDAEALANVAIQYEHLLRDLVTAPRLPVAAASLCTAAERTAAVRAGTGGRRSRPTAGLHELIAQRAAAVPDAVAVVAGPEHVSFRALVRRAASIAARLAAAGVRAGDRVAVLLERSALLPAGLLGILRSGAAYLPLSPDDPQARCAAICRDAGVTVVLTSTSLRQSVPAGFRAICLDGPAEPTRPAPNTPVAAQSPAYVLHTSGSTGGPKAVVVGHAAIVNRLIWMQEHYRLGPDDRVLHKTPITFDVSVWELFWPLLSGSCLVLARPGGHLDGGYLAALARREEVTTAYFVPSLLPPFLDGLDRCVDRPRLPALRRMLCSGETLTAATRDSVLHRLDCELSNLYGPTEAAVDVTAWRCTDELPVRIGCPIANVDVHVLGPECEPLPPDVAGEVHIGGVALGHGYLRRPGATAEVFRPDPVSATPGARLYRTGDRARRLSDGAIEFLGRRDRQVKLRGVRIEPGEVEEALRACPVVSEGAVVVRDGRLVATVVARDPDAGLGDRVLAHLRERLPSSMVPTTVHVVDDLPRTMSGKIDRAAVAALRPVAEPAVDMEAGHRLATTSGLEQIITRAWCAVLGRDSVDPHLNFFDAGGNSMSLIDLQARLQSDLIASVRVLDLVRHPTIAALAAVLEGGPEPVGHTGRQAIGRGRRRAALAGRRADPAGGRG